MVLLLFPLRCLPAKTAAEPQHQDHREGIAELEDPPRRPVSKKPMRARSQTGSMLSSRPPALCCPAFCPSSSGTSEPQPQEESTKKAMPKIPVGLPQSKASCRGPYCEHGQRDSHPEEPHHAVMSRGCSAREISPPDRDPSVGVISGLEGIDIAERISPRPRKERGADPHKGGGSGFSSVSFCKEPFVIVQHPLIPVEMIINLGSHSPPMILSPISRTKISTDMNQRESARMLRFTSSRYGLHFLKVLGIRTVTGTIRWRVKTAGSVMTKIRRSVPSPFKG